jgi:hypothetical protein
LFVALLHTASAGLSQQATTNGPVDGAVYALAESPSHAAGTASSPGAATLVSPSGTITTTTPTYTWNAVSSATYYYLYVSDSTNANGKIQTWYTAQQCSCASGTGTCSVTPSVAIASGAAQWWIQTWNTDGYGPWSSGLPFTVTLSSGPAFLENSQVIATGNQISVYRVPTKDGSGNVQYYNLTIRLSVLANGQFQPSASVDSIVSPTLLTNQFVAGTYQSTYDGGSCRVITSFLNSGRMQVDLSCTKSSYTLLATWVTGPIAGHIFELELKNAGIDQLAAYQDYSWGKVTASTSSYYVWDCFTTGRIISAKQAGDTIVLSLYYPGNTQKCGNNLVKQQ